VIVMRFEAETPAALARIQGQFKRVILAKPDANCRSDAALAQGP
jgi:phosphomannomutase/phosphoglucomutase